jgi:hypothetical protein
MPALEEAWQQVTGHSAPRSVGNYVARRGDVDPGGDP